MAGLRFDRITVHGGRGRRRQDGSLLFPWILSGAIADWLERRTLLWFSTLGGILVSSVMAAMLLSGATHVWAVIGL